MGGFKMSEIENRLQALGVEENDMQSISRVLHTLRSGSPDGSHPLFTQWLSETSIEGASKAVFEFRALNEALYSIVSQLSVLDPVRDKVISFPLLDQFSAMSNGILENSLVKSQPEGAKIFLKLLEKFERWKVLHEIILD